MPERPRLTNRQRKEQARLDRAQLRQQEANEVRRNLIIGGAVTIFGLGTGLIGIHHLTQRQETRSTEYQPSPVATPEFRLKHK